MYNGARVPSALDEGGERSKADLEALAGHLGEAALNVGAPLGQATLLLDRAAITKAATWLREEAGYGFLRSVTAVDFLPVDPRFQVVYHFARLPESVLRGQVMPEAGDPLRAVRLKLAVPETEAIVDSLVPLYPTANWLEREVWDLFGIEFAGHPDLRRILLPDDSTDHPLRKDHPLQYEEVAFSFNMTEVHARKEFASK